MKKPNKNELCLVTWKDGTQNYCTYEINAYKKGNKIKVDEYFLPYFANEPHPKNYDIKNVKSYEVVYDNSKNVAEKAEAFQNHKINYWKSHYDSLQFNSEENDAYKSWCELIKDQEFIDFLEGWISHLEYADGEIDNPALACFLIFKAGYNKAFKDIKKANEYAEDDLK